MKFVKYAYNGIKGFGIIDDNQVTPLVYDGQIIPDFFTYLKVKSKKIEYGKKKKLSEVKLLSPIEYPLRNIFCLGKNYKEHALEMKGKITEEVVVPEYPIYFSKACYKTLEPDGEIGGHIGVSKDVDYEVELAVIIGKEGCHIEKHQVQDYIFGYTIANDISARDLQKSHYQWLKGKSLDGFCPLGPVIIERNDVPYPPDLEIRCYVNDDLRQNAKTSDFIFDLDTIISDLSKGMTLLPGDIILTGTPSGVGMGFKPPRYLKSGDVIKCEIESIGQLTNSLK